jgi:hypothetical protein
MHFRWTGDLPQSWPEMEDMKTKVAFNGAYAGERNQIYLINHMLGSRKLAHGDKYHHIDLIEIEMSQPRGFFGYVFEDMDVFERSLRDSHKRLTGPAAPNRQDRRRRSDGAGDQAGRQASTTHGESGL